VPFHICASLLTRVYHLVYECLFIYICFFFDSCLSFVIYVPFHICASVLIHIYLLVYVCLFKYVRLMSIFWYMHAFSYMCIQVSFDSCLSFGICVPFHICASVLIRVHLGMCVHFSYVRVSFDTSLSFGICVPFHICVCLLIHIHLLVYVCLFIFACLSVIPSPCVCLYPPPIGIYVYFFMHLTHACMSQFNI